MNIQQIENEIYKYLRERFKSNEFDDNTELFNLGMDSIELMMFIVYIEETFHITVDDDVLVDNLILTVSDAVNYVYKMKQ